MPLPCLKSPPCAALLAAALLIFASLAARAATPEFTDDERAWITAHPVVGYGFNPVSPPFSFENHGTHAGLSAELMAELSRRTGIEFRPLVGEAWPSVVDKLRDGRVPLIAQLAITPEREQFAYFTQPFLDLPYGVFTSADGPDVSSIEDLRGKRIGVPREFTIHQRLHERYPGLDFVEIPDAVAGMTRLSLGGLDAVITNVGSATYLSGVRGVARLRMRVLLPDHFEFAVGVTRTEPLLFGIVQKALASIPPDQMRELRDRWLVMPGPGFTHEETFAIAGGVASLVFLVAAIGMALLYTRLRERYSQLRTAEAKLQALATQDELTGLGNRRAYNREIDRELRRAMRTREPLTLVELDLDHFKKVNDELGHEAGDRVLEELGQLIRSELRTTDFAYRVGGEEFVIILPATGEERARKACERLRLAIELIPGIERPVTASLGCVVLPAGRAATPARLYAAADEALYRAKGEGRNRVVVTTFASDEADERDAVAG